MAMLKVQIWRPDTHPDHIVQLPPWFILLRSDIRRVWTGDWFYAIVMIA
jgi:hypothetical protein